MTPPTPDLSIVIVNYNGEHYLANCLDSVFGQDTHYKFEIFLVDNQSTDQSKTVIDRYKTRVHVILNNENLGFSRANNQCFSLCTGRYTLLLNNDTIMHQHALQGMLDYMEEHPNIGALSPKLVHENGQIQTQGNTLTAWRFKSKTPKDVPFICGASLLTRHSLLMDIGGLDEHYFFYNDDLDYCKSVLKRGYRIVYLPTVTVTHLGGLATKTRKAGSIVDGYRGSAYLCHKFYPRPIFYLYHALVLLDVILKLLVYSILSLYNKPLTEHRSAYATVFILLVSGKLQPK